MIEYEEALNFFINQKAFKDKKEEIICSKKQICEKLREVYGEPSLKYFAECMLLRGYNKCSTTSVVYFIRNEYTGLLKIGCTKNLDKRIEEIKRTFTFLGLEKQKLVLEALSYCPLGLKNNIVEAYYHQIFAKKRTKGEWFDVSFNDLCNVLNVDNVINKVIITIEDPTDFNQDFSYSLIEDNEEYMDRIVTDFILDKLEILNLHSIDDIASSLSKPYDIHSEDLYSYIQECKKNYFDGKSYEYDTKHIIIKNIEKILQSCILI